MRKSFVVVAAVSVMMMTAACRKESPAPKPAKRAPKKVEAPKPAPGSTEVGAVMPAYSVARLDGGEFSVGAEKGKVVFLNLWATWCTPCRAEIPELQALHDKYKSQGFEVVGVSLDDIAVDEVRKFVRDHKMTYPVAVDAEGRLANIFQTSVLPTSALIDRNGKIVWKEYGAVSMTDATLQKALSTALATK